MLRIAPTSPQNQFLEGPAITVGKRVQKEDVVLSYFTEISCRLLGKKATGCRKLGTHK